MGTAPTPNDEKFNNLGLLFKLLVVLGLLWNLHINTRKIRRNYIFNYWLVEMTTELIGMGECSSPKPRDSCHTL